MAHAVLLSILFAAAGVVAQAPEAPSAQPIDASQPASVPPPVATVPSAQPSPATPEPAVTDALPPPAVPAPEPTTVELPPPPSEPEASLSFRATPNAPTRRPTVVAEPEPASPDHESRSLYLRMGAGVGFPFGTDVTDAYAIRGNDELRFSGYSFAVDLMAGSAVLPWLMLGGGVSSDSVVGGTVRKLGQSERSIERGLYYAVLGGFADIYTSPPAGLHFQALLGLARLSPSYNLGLNTALGFGAVLGVGYELRAGRRWNVGLLARVAISPLSMDAVGGHQPSPSLYEPSILWTATFRPEAE